MGYCNTFVNWSRHQESNLDLSLRRTPFYPLNYSESWVRCADLQDQMDLA